WFNANMWDGLDGDKAYVFGGRSFSIYEATDSGLTLVFDSGSDFEEITADKLADYFNASNDKISLDNRSGKKGPEPESVVTGVIGNKTFAFVALERIGGIMVYDITDPANAKFANYINSREFDEAIKGDVSPEGLCFVSAENSKTGKATLLAACEVSGTLAAYECDYEEPVHNHKLVLVKAENATAAKDGNTEYYYCEDCGKYFSNEAGTKEISKADTVISKLAPKIIEGNSIKIDKSSKESVSFRSDAASADFIRVELDGKELVKDKDYTVKEGSIIVTLSPEFVATLSSGEHTLGIVSTSGTATATFTVTESKVDNGSLDVLQNDNSGNKVNNSSSDVFSESNIEKSPQTAENTLIGSLIALIILSGCALIGLTVYSKKKR
ncbi:MAG: choice-of-anchor I domain-containing protein, partial [Acutalibacteraceae bacterium]